MLEIEAFLDIHRAWQRLGYPFDNLVPSYGSSIGSSGDRPDALAQLVGIIMNDGVRLQAVRLTRLDMGVGTPYETRWSIRPTPGDSVMSADVASVARRAIDGVVESGTGRSVRDAVQTSSGNPVVVGGKTGTGNNQFRVFGGRGTLIRTRTINRTATFAFHLGDRHFGVITAHVDGDQAAGYTFTSALPLAVLRLVSPAIAHLLDEPEIDMSTATAAGGG